MNKIMLRRFLLTAFIITFGGAAVFACEMIFTLEGQSYKITVEFNEDHRNCKVPADETLFLLNGEKWRVNKETQALLLTKSIAWDAVTNTKSVTVLEFTPSVKGEQVLQIVRECSKGGYDEEITFVVE